jgi:hypothetical protein
MIQFFYIATTTYKILEVERMKDTFSDWHDNISQIKEEGIEMK